MLEVMADRHCMFCGGSLKGRHRANEHVIGKWLLSHLEIRFTKIPFWTYDAEGTLINSREQVMDSLKAGHVCLACNGGWMKESENLMLDLLPPLISGTRASFELGKRERLIIARWITKSAFCIDVAHRGGAKRRVPPDHCRILRDKPNGLPRGVQVTATRSPFHTKFDYIDSPCWYTTGRLGLAKGISNFEKDSRRSYKIGFQFGHLVLVVFYWPRSDDVIAITQDHFPLFGDAKVRLMSVEPSTIPTKAHDWLALHTTALVPVPPDLPSFASAEGIRHISRLNS